MNVGTIILNGFAGADNGFTTSSLTANLTWNADSDTEAKTEDGQTPLHLAAERSKKPEVVSLLLDRNANSNAKNEDGRTPFDLARGNEHLKGSDAYWRLNESQSQ